jgi:hypothetical protein
VNWGDFTVSKGKAGATFSHTYRKGGKFKITQTVEEPHGLKEASKVKVVIPK